MKSQTVRKLAIAFAAIAVMGLELVPVAYAGCRGRGRRGVFACGPRENNAVSSAYAPCSQPMNPNYLPQYPAVVPGADAASPAGTYSGACPSQPKR